MPLNIAEFHWVLGFIDLQKRHVYFYDSALTYDTNREAFNALWIMLPYVLRAANFFERHPKIKKKTHGKILTLLYGILSKTKKWVRFLISNGYICCIF